ncbi:3-phosphoshikimate 1-carboxyvinyltransferase [Prolixibacteraceae bacterium JC049]|nr:3-phosphoshikimate 1-carboxyvinyltransferase [Prolixibacteraceae bacterium JC049]
MEKEIYGLNKADNILKGTIELPTSKSISNRVLIINSLAYSPYDIENLSDCDDTRAMMKVLNSNTRTFDVGHAGTAMRFLTAFLSKIVGEWVITGSERMQQRPIGILVDALNKLGAKIEYEGKEGYPPLRIWGSHLKGPVLELDGSVSSQFISALLMIAPTLENGLSIRLKNKVMSRSYIELTLKIMEQFGVRSLFMGNEIRIEEQQYKPVPFKVEADWSAASYWFQMAAMAEKADISLKGLRWKSVQGDSELAKWFEEFGLKSKQEGDVLRVKKVSDKKPKRLTLNFTQTPDVAQTMAVLCVMKKVPFHFTGLETLKIKETNRIEALINELAKFGAKLEEPKHGELKWDGFVDPSLINEEIVIPTYDDHRMAMAFAPAAMQYSGVKIEEPSVVTKSYPNFWEDLKKVDFSVE